MVTILSQLYHTFPPYFPKIHSNIDLQSMPVSSEWSHPFRFSGQNFVFPISSEHISYPFYLILRLEICHVMICHIIFPFFFSI